MVKGNAAAGLTRPSRRPTLKPAGEARSKVCAKHFMCGHSPASLSTSSSVHASSATTAIPWWLLCPIMTRTRCSNEATSPPPLCFSTMLGLGFKLNLMVLPCKTASLWLLPHKPGLDLSLTQLQTLFNVLQGTVAYLQQTRAMSAALLLTVWYKWFLVI